MASWQGNVFSSITAGLPSSISSSQLLIAAGAVAAVWAVHEVSKLDFRAITRSWTQYVIEETDFDLGMGLDRKRQEIKRMKEDVALGVLKSRESAMASLAETGLMRKDDVETFMSAKEVSTEDKEALVISRLGVSRDEFDTVNRIMLGLTVGAEEAVEHASARCLLSSRRVGASATTREEDKETAEIEKSGALYTDNLFRRAVDAFLAYTYSTSNSLHADIFAQIPEIEARMRTMLVRHLGGPPHKFSGVVTSGGTQSIFESVKAHLRRYEANWKYRYPSIRLPRRSDLKLVCSEETHVAFTDAAEIMGISVVKIPVSADTHKVDVVAMREAVDAKTILVVANAISYPFGIADDVAKVAKIAEDKDIGCHVDGCLGSLLTNNLPQFKDTPLLQIPGITAVSIDYHKFGGTCKGASALILDIRSIAPYVTKTKVDAATGLYVSATSAGSRSGFPSVSSYLTLLYYGSSGYNKLAQNLIALRKSVQEEIVTFLEEKCISPSLLRVAGNPQLSVLGFTGAWAHKVSEVLKEDESGLRFSNVRDGFHWCFTERHLKHDFAEKIVSALKRAIVRVELNPGAIDGGDVALYSSIARIPASAGFVTEDLGRTYQAAQNMTLEELRMYRTRLSARAAEGGLLTADVPAGAVAASVAKEPDPRKPKLG